MEVRVNMRAASFVLRTLGWSLRRCVPTDDIECEITVDGNALRYISNDDIGDFEQDAIRESNQWIRDLVRISKASSSR